MGRQAEFSIVHNHAAGRRERWYLARAKPLAEKAAAFQLDRQGVTTYLPLQMSRVRRGGTWRHRVAAYFPGYVFLTLDVERDRWRSVNGTTGVARLVAAGDGAPQPVPDGIVEALMAATDGDGFLHLEKTFKAGDNVRFADGPLASFLGTIDKMKGTARALVLVDLMMRQMPIWTDTPKLVPA
ncbi:unnamed protein product [marine sediment metagenome]|uniref:NusG-like N-terminal domain-containing protein n=1 Tax=marine sediment metagenome TaxID=412755 RepID=X0T2J7_9ZZZZ